MVNGSVIFQNTAQGILLVLHLIMLLLSGACQAAGSPRPLSECSRLGFICIYNMNIHVCTYIYIYIDIICSTYYLFYIFFIYIYYTYFDSHTRTYTKPRIFIRTTKMIFLFDILIFWPKPALSWFYCYWHVFAMQHCQKPTI